MTGRSITPVFTLFQHESENAKIMQKNLPPNRVSTYIHEAREMVLPGRNDSMLRYFADNLPDAGIEFCHAGIDDEFGIFRGFIRRGDAGEVGDLSGTGFFVHAFYFAGSRSFLW